MANYNPILDSRMLEVKYCDRYLAAMAANIITENQPQDRTIVCIYVIRDEAEESNRNCKYVANAVLI